MTIDVDFWSNGADPFDIPWGGFVLHIHAGSKPEGASPGTAQPIPVTAPILTLPVKPDLPPPLLLRENDSSEIEGWLDSAGIMDDLTIRMDVPSGAATMNLQSVLDGLGSHGDSLVRLEVVGWAPGDDG